MPNKGKIALVFFSLLGFCGFLSILVYLYGIFKGPAFEESVALVRSHEEVIAQFGSPIEASFFVSGSWFYYGAFLQYEIKGPKATGTVFVSLWQNKDEWKLESVRVFSDAHSEFIQVTDISEEPADGSCGKPDEDYELDLPPEETKEANAALVF